MDSTRWKQIDTVLQAVLELPAAQRDAYLHDACAADPALEREVRSLIACETPADSFLEQPAALIAARALDKGTGARGLRSIVEHVMVDIMFELPDQPKGSKFVIDDDVVRGRKPLFTVQEPMQKSA